MRETAPEFGPDFNRERFIVSTYRMSTIDLWKEQQETEVAQERVKSEITGKVWKILTTEGAAVGEEEALIIIESMKMEIPVLAPIAGKVLKILVQETQDVSEGQDVAIIET